MLTTDPARLARRANEQLPLVQVELVLVALELLVVVIHALQTQNVLLVVRVAVLGRLVALRVAIKLTEGLLQCSELLVLDRVLVILRQLQLRLLIWIIAIGALAVVL